MSDGGNDHAFALAAAQATVKHQAETMATLKGHLIEIGQVVECSTCMEGSAEIAFDCGHTHCNSATCPAVNFTVCPSCGQTIQERRPADLRATVQHVFGIVEKANSFGKGLMMSDFRKKRCKERKRLAELEDECKRLHATNADLSELNAHQHDEYVAE
eukprot:1907143-Rhodomonas_salina.1